MYQRLILVGNLGRDPELRYTPQGTAVTTFSVATSRKYETASGDKAEQTVWFRVSVFGAQAETVNQYLSKGSKVLVEGALTADGSGSPRIWTGSDGKPRASFEVRASTVRFLNMKEVAENAPQKAEEQDGDEIPF